MVWLLVLLVHEVCDLLLWTLQKPVDLALPLVLDRVVAPLYAGGVHRELARPSVLASATHHDPRLRAGRPGAWSSDLPVMTLLRLLHVLALDVLVFDFTSLFLTPPPLVVAVNHNVELVERIEAARVLSSPLVIVALSPPLCGVGVVNKRVR